MAVKGECKRCGTPIEKPKSPRTTVKKYCSAECRDSWWNEKRATGATWGQRCEVRYGVVEPLRLSEVKAIWLAAVIDGEGTIGLYKQQRPANKSKVRYYANVEVAGTHKGFIQTVADTMRVPLFVKDRQMRNPGCKVCYGAKATRRLVRRVLEAVRPYLIIKGEQADIVLAFLDKLEQATSAMHSLHVEFEEMYQRMKALNKRGVSQDIQASPITQVSNLVCG